MPSRLRGQLGCFLLLGVAGAAVAADGLPPLRVDPALLGEPPVAKPAAAPEPAAAATATVVAPVTAAPAPATPAPVPAQAAPRKSAASPAPAVAAAPAARPGPAVQVAPVASQPAAPAQPASLAPVTPYAPPEVAERPVVPPTYSALVAAGQLPDPRLKPSGALAPMDKDDKQPRPTFVSADRISGRNDIETVAEGDVELRRLGQTLNADQLTYWQAEDEVDAVGHVRFANNDDVVTGPHLRMKLEENTGYFEQPAYSFKRVPVGIKSRQPVTGTGEADRLEFQGEGVYRLVKNTYSTCKPEKRDWYVEAADMQLDYNRETGEAKEAKVVFQGQPILYSPWLGFSLNNQRKSGLLTPTFGASSRTGTEAAVPVYWNIAPNMDATFTPREMAKRGLQLNGEFRYLDFNYSGQDHVEYLPDDHLTGTRRYAYSISHTHVLGQGLIGNLNLNGASDGTYFTDLSSQVTTVTQANLLRQGSLTLTRDWWSASLVAQRYQTLQDPSAPPATVPYYRLPQFTLTATRADLPVGLNLNFNGEYVNFGHPTQVIGRRATLYPQLSLPYATPAFYVTPKLGFSSTRYLGLERQAAGVPDQLTRNVPILSVDSGVVFERSVDWFGRSLTQTLEPRLYYLYVPYRDQSQMPVFDTGLADFNFAQIFSENRYSGGDRIGDANQLTAAAVSRIVDPDTGAELMRGMIGQRFYFSDQRVTLPAVLGADGVTVVTPAEVARTTRKTDLLAAFSGMVMPKTYLDTAWQYSPNFSRTERFNLGGRYQPETAKVFNAGYRYSRDLLGQIDVSGQWPLKGGWYGVGRYNYSTKDSRLVQAVAGLEYDGGCWVARFVIQRLAVLTGKANTTFYVQLELNGFAKLGSNPLDILKRNVPGYGVINQPATDPVFGVY